MTYEDIQAARDIVLRFWRELDHREYDAVLALFAEDGRWMRGDWLHGREAIGASLQARDKSRHVRHVVTNMIFDEQPGGVMVSFLVTAFAGDGDGSGPLPSKVPALLGDVEITLAADGGNWLISSITMPKVNFIDPDIAVEREHEQSKMATPSA